MTSENMASEDVFAYSESELWRDGFPAVREAALENMAALNESQRREYDKSLKIYRDNYANR